MGDTKNDKEGAEKGFVIRDKRFSAEKEEEGKPETKEQGKGGGSEAKKEETSGQDIPLPEVNFVNFVFSLSTSALIQLGEIKDPQTQQQAKSLPLAKQTIDLIGMLREKTKGNLTSDEEKLVETVLYDLRMRYVKATS